MRRGAGIGLLPCPLTILVLGFAWAQSNLGMVLVVARGETLSLIAARHGVGVDSIREANRRRDDTVRVGEALTIPLMASAPK